MTSPVPLRPYHQRTFSDDYSEPDTAITSHRAVATYDDGAYDPYADPPSAQGRPWSDTGYADAEPGTVDMHKPSLSYDSKYLDENDPTDLPLAGEAAMKDERPLVRWLDQGGKYPMEQRIEDKKRGIGRQKYPIVVWTLTVIMVAVFYLRTGGECSGAG